MSSSLPPDPYKALGVARKADAAEIKTAYRKLVLQCHPDKVQDEQLKAQKQEEFTRVQQAWEILGDADKRRHYDAQVEVQELKRSMARGVPPSPRSSRFPFDVRAEARHVYSRTRSSKESPKVYTHRPAPTSFEDVAFEVHSSSAGPRRASSYEARREKASPRDAERERDRERRKAAAAEEEAKIRMKIDKELRKAASSEKKKSRDKDRREKAHSKSAYVEEESEEDPRAQAKAEKKARRPDLSSEMSSASIRKGSLTPKWNGHLAQAAEYMQAAKARRRPQADDEPRPGMMRRAETFAATPTTPQFDARYPLKSSDDEAPRKTAARVGRRSTEVPSKTKDSPKTSSKDKKARYDPYIVEAPVKTPSLQPQSSAPPFIAVKGSRSKTSDTLRHEAPPPPLSRAATFAHGADRDRKTRSKNPVEYVESPSSSSSDSEDEPSYPTVRPARNPSIRRSTPETRYIVQGARAIPVTKVRVDSGFDDGSYDSQPYISEPSPPRLRRAATERPTTESGTQRAHVSARTTPTSYFEPDVADSVAAAASASAAAASAASSTRPKMSGRESSRAAAAHHHRVPYPFVDVKYGPKYGPESVVYSAVPGGLAPSPSQQQHQQQQQQQQQHVYETQGRGARGEVFA